MIPKVEKTRFVFRRSALASLLVFALYNAFSVHRSIIAGRGSNDRMEYKPIMVTQIKNTTKSTNKTRGRNTEKSKKRSTETLPMVKSMPVNDTTPKTKDAIQQTVVTKETNDITSGSILKDNNSNSENKLAELATTPRILKSMITNGTCPPLLDSTMVSVSLVIHSTIDRLWLMEETCRRWKGPIVLVVYFNASNTAEKPWLQVLDWNAACPQIKLIPVPASQDEQEWQYPVNKLRNIGLDALETTLFLMMDADFLPSGELEANIKYHFLSTSKFYFKKAKRQHRIAMVVPAFERIRATCDTVNECKQFLKKDSRFVPLSFEGINDCVKIGNCQSFQSDIFLDGHSSTGSESWLRGEFFNEKNVSKKIVCFHSYRYEPYVVLQWCKDFTPYYDERFFGYGKNKIEHISHLRFLNYSFHVLPEGFLAHHPHKKSKSQNAFRKEDTYGHRKKMDYLYYNFLAELNQTHGMPRIVQCKKNWKKLQREK